MVRPHVRSERREGVRNGRYKGIRMRKWGKWVAEVRQPNSRHRIWLGSYETAEEAARAYDAALFCLRGPSVMLNFPDDPPDIPSAADLTRSQIQVAASRHARKVSVADRLDANEAPPPPQVVVEPVFFEAAAEWDDGSGCSFSELSSRGDYYLASRDHGSGGSGDGVDGNGGFASGGFFEPPRMWSF